MKLKPNERQRNLLERHFGHNRFIWNYFLSERLKQYQEEKITSTYFRDCKKLTALKGEKDWLYEVSTGSQQRTLKNLDDAYKRFFKKKAHFPRFKSKHGEQSFTQQAREVYIRNGRILLPKFQEGIKFKRRIPLFTKICSISVHKTPDGEYYASLSVEREVFALPPTGQQCGIDLGLTDLAVFSTGQRIKAPKHFRRLQRQLKVAQQHLARKVKGSKRRNKQRVKVAGIHRKIANSRLNTLHNVSSYAVKNHDVIAVESLAVKNMVKNHSLALSISDAGWGELTRQLEYKSKWYGREFRQVGRFYPSSKTCGNCNWLNHALTLKDRTWVCPSCGSTHDRDLNAAKNILTESGRQPTITDMEKV